MPRQASDVPTKSLARNFSRKWFTFSLSLSLSLSPAARAHIHVGEWKPRDCGGGSGLR